MWYKKIREKGHKKITKRDKNRYEKRTQALYKKIWKSTEAWYNKIRKTNTRMTQKKKKLKIGIEKGHRHNTRREENKKCWKAQY